MPKELRATALMIGLRADRYGNCWPSYEQIAADIRASRRTAIRHIHQLRDTGWLMTTRRSNGHGNQSNSYLLSTPHNLWKTQGGSDTHDTTLVTPTTPHGDTHVTPQVVTPMSPRRGIAQRSEDEPARQPVDNRHLKAVINGLTHQHRIPN